MVEYDAIINAIGSLGFPIVACIYMAWIVNQQEKTHGEAMNKISDAIAELKNVITVLGERIGKD